MHACMHVCVHPPYHNEYLEKNVALENFATQSGGPALGKGNNYMVANLHAEWVGTSIRESVCWQVQT